MTTHLPSAWPANTDVLAVDLDLRERPHAEALTTMRLVSPPRGARVFVKIDSTLRGPVAALINGALEVAGSTLAVVAPAFPEQGRVFRQGQLFVDGQPGPSLLELLDVATSIRPENLEHTGPRAQPYVIVDAETSTDLSRVAEAAGRHPEWMLVGSAGLARALAPVHEPGRIQAAGGGPVLVVAGSPTAVTRAQLRSVRALEEVVILATPDADERDAGEAAAALAETVAAWAQAHRPRAVVLTGGATARAVGHRLGATSLRIHGELEPGIPVGVFADGVWQGVPVVTKAGGFGTPETLLDVVRVLGVSSDRC